MGDVAVIGTPDGYHVCPECGHHYVGPGGILLDENGCADPDCDGQAGHDGPHFQWVPE